MQEISIRQATPEDAEQVFKVRAETWLSTYPNKELGITTDMIRQKFKNPEAGIEKTRRYLQDQTHTHTWVADDDGVIAGFIVASIADGKQEILAAYILPEYQGNGIGSMLMQSALDWIGEGEIEVHVASYNDQAITYYKKFGFETQGTKDGDLTELPGGKSIPEIRMLRQSKV